MSSRRTLPVKPPYEDEDLLYCPLRDCRASFDNAAQLVAHFRDWHAGPRGRDSSPHAFSYAGRRNLGNLFVDGVEAHRHLSRVKRNANRRYLARAKAQMRGKGIGRRQVAEYFFQAGDPDLDPQVRYEDDE